MLSKYLVVVLVLLALVASMCMGAYQEEADADKKKMTAFSEEDMDDLLDAPVEKANTVKKSESKGADEKSAASKTASYKAESDAGNSDSSSGDYSADSIDTLRSKLSNEHFSIAEIYEALDNTEAAREMYEKALKWNPIHVIAAYKLGNIYFSKKEISKYEALYKTLATELKKANKVKEVLKNFKEACSGNGLVWQVHAAYALLLNEFGKQGDAVAILRDLLELNEETDYWFLKAADLVNAVDGRDAAFNILKSCLKANGQFEACALKKGEIFMEAGLLRDALSVFEKYLSLHPNSSPALRLIADTQVKGNQHQQAVDNYLKAVEKDGNNAEAHFGLAKLLQSYSRFELSNQHYIKALEINPVKYNDVIYEIASNFKGLGHAYLAIEYLERDTTKNPNSIRSHEALAEIYKAGGNTKKFLYHSDRIIAINNRVYEEVDEDEEIDEIDDLLSIFQTTGRKPKAEEGEPLKDVAKDAPSDPKPGTTEPVSIDDLKVCEWKDYNKIREHFKSNIDSKLTKNADLDIDLIQQIKSQPLIDSNDAVLVTKTIAKQIQKKALKSVGKDYKRFIYKNEYGRNYKKTKIRIAYTYSFSYDYPIIKQLQPLFQLYTQDRFEVYCYGLAKGDTSLKKELSNKCTVFRDFSEKSLTDFEIAKAINDDDIDILIYLDGYQQGFRSAYASLRPAPLQISLLEYENSMGANYFDYLITDKTSSPSDLVQLYFEKLVWLPNTHVINNYGVVRRNALDSYDRNALRNKYKVPQNVIVFSSLGSYQDFYPEIFTAWMRILKKVPDSVILFSVDNEQAQANLKKVADGQGVSEERLIFLKKLSKDEVTKINQMVDLSLDVPHNNALVASLDALWAGTPVLTVQGDLMQSRSTSSLLNDLKLESLIVKNLTSYEALAIKLATGDAGSKSELSEIPNRYRNLQGSLELKKIKVDLEGIRDSSPVFDAQSHLENFEKSLLIMWSQYLKSKKEHIDVETFDELELIIDLFNE